MARSNSKQSSRYSDNRHAVKQKKVACQGWDKGTGKCGAESIGAMTYRAGKTSYSWWFCKRHYAKQQRKRYGTCSHVWTQDGGQRRCTSLRVTNTRGPGRDKKGYCRRHEDEYLKAAGEDGRARALDRIARIVTVRADTGCWETPATKGGTRAQIKCGGKPWTTYRFMFTVFYGSHATSLELSHDCANSRCCNPMHVTPIKPRMNRDAEHNMTMALAWAVTSAIKRPPQELQAWADSHGLPLYGTETKRIVGSFMPSEEELLAQYRADLEAEDSDAMALAV